jgi:PAS domain-containing protein
MATGERAVGALPERVLRAALDALPLAVVVIDARERLLYANRPAGELLVGELALGRPVPWAKPRARVAPRSLRSRGTTGSRLWS